MAAGFGLLAAAGAAPIKARAAEGVVGAWSLVSFNVDEPGGKSQPRFGPEPVGYLIYSADSRMSAVLAGTHRPALTSPSGTASSEEARTQALQNFLAYAGRYEVRGDRVFHHVEVSVFTNLIGTTLERRFTHRRRPSHDPHAAARDLGYLQRPRLETRIAASRIPTKGPDCGIGASAACAPIASTTPLRCSSRPTTFWSHGG